ncbi:MAG: xanthine dehydrogenase family protein molybdopterin-binding subunit [Dehalococcoidia bacterium]|nr:xanthine dehydrogenase family protein molybdopterin-binding subunit [Dehalococcoidia bacterium]
MKQYAVIGKGLPRKDALEKATGQALYGADIALPGMLYCRILRSPYPHARILDIDTSRAKRLPGVKDVISAKDVPSLGRSPFKARPPVEKRVFATDKVRFIGDEVAAVAAIDEDIAQEALDLIKVEYEELPAIFEPSEALKPDAPRIHEEEDNLCIKFEITRGDVERAFKEADFIFEDTVVTQIQHQSYLEPVSCVASFDSSGKLTFWVSSMDPSGVRACLAEILAIPESRVRVIHTFVGGAFGGKLSSMPIQPICAILSQRTGRPVKAVNSREDEFMATLPRVAASIEIRTGFKKDGTLLVKHSKVLADSGAYRSWAGGIVNNMVTTADTAYRFSNAKAEARIVYTNKTPPGPFRGFGTMQMSYAMETHLDRVAASLGLDPMELRLKNATRAGDTTLHGFRIGSCGLSDCIQVAAKASGWKEKRAGKSQRQGIGMACGVYHCDSRVTDNFCGSVAFVQLSEDGKAHVISGEADCGQGWTTVAAQVAAEELGLPYEDVSVSSPDTDFTPYAEGPWGLRVTVSGGNAVKLAAADAKAQLLQVASELLEANVADLEIIERQVRVKGSPEKSLPVSKVASTAIFRRGGSAIVGKGIDEPDTKLRDRVTLYGNYTRGFIFASQVAQVEVDTETGQLEVSKFVSACDVGQPVNTMSVEGQLQGSIATGMGFGLSEEVCYREGTVLNPSFLDYKIPTAVDMPHMESTLMDIEEPNTPFGIKAAGNLVVVAPSPAIANALQQSLGIKIGNLPLWPDRVLAALDRRGPDE